MRRIISLFVLVAALLVVSVPAVKAQTTYDSTNVKVNSGDPTSATFTFNSNLTQVQFRCVNGGNPTWFYYTRPNVNSQFVEQGYFPMAKPTACQYSYSTDGDIQNDVLTVVVNSPLTGHANNGQTVTVVFGNFTSDKDGRVYDTAVGSARITVDSASTQVKPGTCWWDGKGADWKNITCAKTPQIVLSDRLNVCTDDGKVWWRMRQDGMCHAADNPRRQ